MDLQTLAYQTLLEHAEETYDAKATAAETIQRWWIATRFIHANPRMVMVTCVKRGTSFKKTIQHMITYVFGDLTAQTIDYMTERDESATHGSVNQMKREILRMAVNARTFNIMVAASDGVDADASLFPTQWIVLSEM
jgi:hypothetical protein